MPTEYMSALENNFVASIFKSNDNKSFGNLSCLQLLLKEIQELSYNGIDLVVDNKKQHVFLC